MDAITWMIRKFSRSEPTNGTPPVSEAPPVRCALVRKGDELQITFTDSKERGVRIVEMPSALERRYWLALEEWDRVQEEIASLDYTHRKRKTRKRPTLESIAARDSECVGVEGEPE